MKLNNIIILQTFVMDNFNDNKARGFFKVYRSIDHWEWYKESYCVHLFLHILNKGNHKCKKWRGITINRGQFITSIEQLSIETGISIQSVKTTLKRLRHSKEISTKATSKNTMITICNYDSYQDLKVDANKPPNHELTINQLASNQQLTTTKNVNNYKEVNNNIYKEIFKNLENYYQNFCNKNKLSTNNNLNKFFDFYELNYADTLEVFKADKVKIHYKNSLNKQLEYEKKKKTSKKRKKIVNNRPTN